MSLTIFWLDNLNSGQGAAISSASAEFRHIQQSWDINQNAQGNANVDSGPSLDATPHPIVPSADWSR